ncbi:MAG TPA: hypothetical protein PKD28_00725 [Candidatus Saccharibacteria bacterium]|nr:hypothetical protein [Candidatus Saccharibacteria bacterium]
MAKKQTSHKKGKPMSISAFFSRFHAVIFFVVVCGALTVAIYMLSTIITGSSTLTDYTPPSTNATFDTETINRVNELRDLDTPPKPLELPSDARTDPFAG